MVAGAMSVPGSPGSRLPLGWAGASSGTTLASPLPQTFLQTPTTQCCQPGLLGQPFCASQNAVFEGGVWLLSLHSTLAGSREQNSIPKLYLLRVLVLGLWAKVVGTQNDLCPLPRGTAGVPRASLFLGCTSSVI